MFECLLFFCYLGGAPAGAVPDGAGGYVPFTNSRVMPDGSLRPYDPAIDGTYPVEGYAAPPPAPYYPGPYYPPGPGYYAPYGNRAWIRPYPSPYQP